MTKIEQIPLFKALVASLRPMLIKGDGFDCGFMRREDEEGVLVCGGGGGGEPAV
jgi:hypothetical protein